MNPFTCFFLKVLLKYSLIFFFDFLRYTESVVFFYRTALIQMQGGYKRSYVLKQTFLDAGWFENVRPFITTRQSKD